METHIINMSKNKTVTYRLGSWTYIIIGLLAAMVGYTIHHSLFWSIVDFFFYPIAIIKWIICKQLTLSVLKTTFSWFFK